ncbi:MAG: hypothetical protein HON90_11720 [Halobacteriovoraceae bacterium]|jgi:hypothetical protein|nr:hypothetical protein [Halobacteriovoraceae bacterium]
MAKLLLFIFIFTIYNCDTVEEEYLYNSNSPEYADILAWAAQECVDNAEVFDALDTAGDFEGSGQLNRIYKITQDDHDSETIFMKIYAVSASEMQVIVSSSVKLDKRIIFSKTDHDELLAQLKIVACSEEYKANFSASGLDNSDRMTLTWKKETVHTIDGDDDDDVADKYSRQTDTLIFDRNLPLFFYFYNGTKTGDLKKAVASDKVTGTSKISIVEVTGTSECSDDERCNLLISITDTSSFPTCEIEINKNKFETNAYSDEFFSPASSGCVFLESADV